ncbi:MAG TPA: PAS domain S-box protein, partial [Chryseosolibacter sp.]|nr:PAS domain S-box protein [Chryseosolibacter sp.]
YGFSEADLVGEHHRLLATKEEKNSEEYRQFWRDLANGQIKKGLFKRINSRGELLTVYANFAPIRSRAGEVLKIMEIAYQMATVEELVHGPGMPVTLKDQVSG